MTKQNQTLGAFLKKARKEMELTLRNVEDRVDISNAYLSQLEGNKIRNPSPTILYKLANLYEISYEHLMELTGYPVPGGGSSESRLAARIGPVTSEEEEHLLDYLAFLRARRS